MPSTSCVCAKLRRSARTTSAIYDSELAPSGLSVAQFSLLRMLERAGPSSLSRFGAMAGYDRTTLNRTLRPLEEAGLVVSSTSADKRARIVAITDAATAKLRLAEPYWARAQARIGHALGPDKEALFAMLDRIEELRA